MILKRFMMLTVMMVFSVNVYARSASYDFKDPKGVNAISIVLDSILEPNVGFASDIKGIVTIDHTNRKILKGEITLPAKSIRMSNSTMTKVLHSNDWLNSKKFPQITFVFDKIISMSKMTESEYNFTVEGHLTIKGVTKKTTAPVSLTFLPGKLGMRNKRDKGDLVILRSKLSVNRSDFQISTDTPKELVAEEIELNINIAGAFRP